MDLVAVIIHAVSDFYTTDDNTEEAKEKCRVDKITFKVKKSV